MFQEDNSYSKNPKCKESTYYTKCHSANGSEFKLKLWYCNTDISKYITVINAKFQSNSLFTYHSWILQSVSSPFKIELEIFFLSAWDYGNTHQKVQDTIQLLKHSRRVRVCSLLQFFYIFLKLMLNSYLPG